MILDSRFRDSKRRNWKFEMQKILVTIGSSLLTSNLESGIWNLESELNLESAGGSHGYIDKLQFIQMNEARLEGKVCW